MSTLSFDSFMASLPLLLLSVLALVCEAICSGAEMALINANRLKLKKASDEGHQGARLALNLLQRPDQLLATLLIGTNVCVLLQGTLVTVLAHRLWRDDGDIYVIAAVTPIVLIFGELLPKTIFQRYSDSLAPRIAFLVAGLRSILSPILWLVSRYTSWVSRKLRPVEEMLTGKHKDSHREALAYLLSHGHKETSLKKFESQMLHRILGFTRAQARNALIPLVQVDAISNTMTVQEALKVFFSHRHSRLPVYQDRIDNIVGIVHVFDLFSESNLSRRVEELMTPAFFVPESQKMNDLFFVMQSQGIQMAIVVDEYGGAVGVLTLEDLIEEIVGNISDEYDTDTEIYKEIKEGEYLIHAQAEIEMLNEQLQLNIPTGNYETLAGFLLLQFNRIPEEGDELFFGKLKFVIRKANSKMIQTVVISQIPELSEST